MINNKYEGTMDQELLDAVAFSPESRCVCTHRGR